MYDYTQEKLIDSLRNVGFKNGDNILIHSNLGFFGKLNNVKSTEGYCKAFKKAIFEIIGEHGTLVVPTFTYSFCWDMIFDVEKTPTSDSGVFSEFIRKDPLSKRSEDGIHSITAIGKNAIHFTENAPEYSFGKNSFWEKFMKLNGKICRFNLNADFNTFIHYVEKNLEVKYRWDKKFNGTAIINGKELKKVNYHFVRDLSDSRTIPDLSKLESKMKEHGLINVENLGRGQILCVNSKDVFKIIKNEINKNPNFLIKGEFFKD